MAVFLFCKNICMSLIDTVKPITETFANCKFFKGWLMFESIIIVTNNPESKYNFCGKHTVELISGPVTEVLEKVRDYVHAGHKILTHPLMSSIKPNETPYRTVVITKRKEKVVDLDSLNIIESSIAVTDKFMKAFSTPEWKESVLKDFQVIDYDMIYHALY